MSEKKVRFAKYDPKIMLNLTKPVIQSNQYCNNCGYYQFDTNDMTCKKCLVTNKDTKRTLKPRANSFSKSEQNLNRYNDNKDVKLSGELKKYSKEFESLNEKLTVPKPKKLNSLNSFDKKDLTWKCYNCYGSLNPGELAVNAEPVFDPLARWHIKCFVCSICNHVLVDLLFYCRDKKLYCKKHYCMQKQSITCAACDISIESNEYIKAENKYWHCEHFTCWNCENSLAGKKYIVVDSKPYCFDCHLLHFSKQCQTCQQKIQQDITRLTYDNLDWHAVPECFKCFFCHKNLLETHFLLKKNLLFCSVECKKHTSII